MRPCIAPAPVAISARPVVVHTRQVPTTQLGLTGCLTHRAGCAQAHLTTHCAMAGWSVPQAPTAAGIGGCLQNCKDPCSFLASLNVARASLGADGTCTIESCQPGFEDCDKKAENGCEVSRWYTRTLSKPYSFTCGCTGTHQYNALIATALGRGCRPLL
jgi:hypothetical protein